MWMIQARGFATESDLPCGEREAERIKDNSSGSVWS